MVYQKVEPEALLCSHRIGDSLHVRGCADLSCLSCLWRLGYLLCCRDAQGCSEPGLPLDCSTPDIEETAAPFVFCLEAELWASSASCELKMFFYSPWHWSSVFLCSRIVWIAYSPCIWSCVSLCKSEKTDFYVFLWQIKDALNSGQQRWGWRYWYGFTWWIWAGLQ